MSTNRSKAIRVLQRCAAHLVGKTGEVVGSWVLRGRRVLRVMIEGVPWGFYADEEGRTWKLVKP
ncbi:hypothetical protein [Polyangium sorediatum]|uniref:Uncharacterized protein n=1 Tax=Polyangium sorediatum TaxID=889274 RepID=A0ABT6NL74_9BACT|nr:hypothetical protein [Polyangium sorediatum]MDI1429053.1 hypothetical protein [Polyangium sorediatum]